MPDAVPITLSEISSTDVTAVAQFLHENLNARLSAARWAEAMTPTWSQAGPNHGFKLEADGVVVGANVAFYSSRPPAGATSVGQGSGKTERQFCNVAALCVRPDVRSHTLRLVRALTKQPGWTFTDLSPSGNVVELDRRLGFTPLDTTTAALLNLPGRGAGGLRLVTDLGQIAARLEQHDEALAAVFDDHRRALAARHLLLVGERRCCYLVYRRDRRKRLPLFASLLFVSDAEVYAEGIGLVARHLLREGALVTLAERRLLDGRRPSGFGVLFTARPKLYRSKTLAADQVDYLYSELTCVPW